MQKSREIHWKSYGMCPKTHRDGLSAHCERSETSIRGAPHFSDSLDELKRPSGYITGGDMALDKRQTMKSSSRLSIKASFAPSKRLEGPGVLLAKGVEDEEEVELWQEEDPDSPFSPHPSAK